METKTISLTGTEQKVKVSGKNCDIRNDSADIIYCSSKAGVTSGADGVLAIPTGQAAKYFDTNGEIYLLGSGSVQLIGNDYNWLVFKVAATSSGAGGADEVARQAISSHANNADIHYTDEKAITAAGTTLTNPNLLINSDFRINQRGAAEYTAKGNALDRWYISDKATVSVNDGYITLTKQDPSMAAELIQKLELPYSALAGKTVTISAILSDGTKISATGTIPEIQPITTTAFVNAPDYSLRFLWSANGYYFFSILLLANKADPISVKKVKLELGTISTIENDICDKAAELAKCQRYYQIHSTNSISPVDLRPTMAEITDIRERGDGTYEFIADV